MSRRLMSNNTPLDLSMLENNSTSNMIMDGGTGSKGAHEVKSSSKVSITQIYKSQEKLQ